MSILKNGTLQIKVSTRWSFFRGYLITMTEIFPVRRETKRKNKLEGGNSLYRADKSIFLQNSNRKGEFRRLLYTSFSEQLSGPLVFSPRSCARYRLHRFNSSGFFLSARKRFYQFVARRAEDTPSSIGIPFYHPKISPHQNVLPPA